MDLKLLTWFAKSGAPFATTLTLTLTLSITLTLTLTLTLTA